MTPHFNYPGSKTLLKEWILDYCPSSGNRYGELFAGVGNFFWYARQNLWFSSWFLNDVKTARFFDAIKDVDIEDVPQTITKADYGFLKDEESPMSIAVERDITAFGTGYERNCFLSTFRYPKFVEKIRECKRLLQGVSIGNKDYGRVNWLEGWGQSDFVYIDPPYDLPYYYKQPYPSIDHRVLLQRVVESRTRILVSGVWPSPVYESYIGKPIATREITASMGGYNVNGDGRVRTEALWRNF